jgi:hypothetical protein
MGGTLFDTGGYHFFSYFFAFLYPLIDSMEAESALLHYPVGPSRKWPGSPNAAVRGQILTIIWLFFLFFVIETSGSIGTGNDTIFASDAPSVILHNDSVFPSIGRLYRAHWHAWGPIAMQAGHGYQLSIHPRIFAVGNGDHLVPINLPSQFLLFG